MVYDNNEKITVAGECEPFDWIIQVRPTVSLHVINGFLFCFVKESFLGASDVDSLDYPECTQELTNIWDGSWGTQETVATVQIDFHFHTVIVL